MTDRDATARAARHVAELIELGRDREAAEVAAAHASPAGHARTPTGGDQMDVFSQLDELGPLLMGVVGEISPEQLASPTPCAAFDVRGVLEHMIGGATLFAAAFSGVEPGTPDTSDVLAAFGPALAGLAQAIHGPGALDRTIHAPFGDMPGSAFARYVVLDGLVHGWDLATATGQLYEPSDALVDEASAYAKEALAPLRDGDTFAEPVVAPPSASPVERLAAFTGRQP